MSKRNFIVIRFQGGVRCYKAKNVKLAREATNLMLLVLVSM